MYASCILQSSAWLDSARENQSKLYGIQYQLLKLNYSDKEEDEQLTHIYSKVKDKQWLANSNICTVISKILEKLLTVGDIFKY